MLGLFRQPLQGKLQDGFKSAARRLKKAGWAGSTALSAESKYDNKAKKFAPSEVETHYKLSAPGVYVSSDGGKVRVRLRLGLGLGLGLGLVLANPNPNPDPNLQQEERVRGQG